MFEVLDQTHIVNVKMVAVDKVEMNGRWSNKTYSLLNV